VGLAGLGGWFGGLFRGLVLEPCSSAGVWYWEPDGGYTGTLDPSRRGRSPVLGLGTGTRLMLGVDPGDGTPTPFRAAGYTGAVGLVLGTPSLGLGTGDAMPYAHLGAWY
jgi:hypothetical protein